MSLYAIGDFHLSFTVNKPMDVFDKRWKNHVVKIEKYWKKRVTENDTVVITGDHSWGRDLAECQADLDFIMALPGRKILLRGNHDMFWDAKKTESRQNKCFHRHRMKYHPALYLQMFCRALHDSSQVQLLDKLLLSGAALMVPAKSTAYPDSSFYLVSFREFITF